MNLPTHILERARDLYSYRDEPERFHALADLYWRALLAFIAIITVCALTYGMWELFTILNPTPADVVAKSSPDVLNKLQLQSVLDRFAARRAAYEKLKNNPPRSADPAK